MRVHGLVVPSHYMSAQEAGDPYSSLGSEGCPLSKAASARTFGREATNMRYVWLSCVPDRRHVACGVQSGYV